MRIDAYNQISQIYNSAKPSKAKWTKDVSDARDEVQISSFGREYQIAKQAVANASDIREDKVANIKERVDSGNYSVDVNDFAGKLLEKYNASLI